ncbi:hypothetical protein BDV37DRAFT_154958 [Aspergillus pseudonomiae]|uniref:Uncharacterized protein n=1 Tax=Aspergillus pseudonomiae TaxID=1506151 RepID=A0A5N7D816_9EURO|nr:uncharacterized protein BDV37DRAFT_154958 [Aspergillus pseudonomiae]KAE8402566.1 hypothetical protein BDV37DRAFT_154958 [Aspergillus pseudonomiae]
MCHDWLDESRWSIPFPPSQRMRKTQSHSFTCYQTKPPTFPLLLLQSYCVYHLRAFQKEKEKPKINIFFFLIFFFPFSLPFSGKAGQFLHIQYHAGHHISLWTNL